MEDNRTTLIIIGIILLVVLFVFSLNGMKTGWNGYGEMMNMMYNYGFSGMWVFCWLFIILLIIALVLFILWLIRQLQPKDERRR